MKTRFIIFLIISNFSSLYSQHIVSPKKSWSTMYGPISGCDSYFCKSYYIKFEEDTVVDNISYLKIFKAHDEEMKNWTFEGLIREDSGKVYARGISVFSNTEDECLLYDFTKNQGESIYVNCYQDDFPLILDSVRNEVIHKINRKVYYLHDAQAGLTETWIEGIGSSYGILNTNYFQHVTGGSEAMLCCVENESILYHTSGYDNCYLNGPTDIISSTEESMHIKIFPNPAKEFLYIQSAQGFNVSGIFQLYAMDGRLCLSKQVANNYKLEVDISGFKNGMYYYQFFNKSQIVKNTVIINQ